MSKHKAFYFTLLIVLVSVIEGCTTMQSGTSTTLPSSAFFPVDASELKPLQAIAHAQDARMKSCHKGPACEDAYYTRALVALFENRADAITVFQELRTAMPNSRYEVATLGWLGWTCGPIGYVTFVGTTGQSRRMEALAVELY